jgi:hypothetical protein
MQEDRKGEAEPEVDDDVAIQTREDLHLMMADKFVKHDGNNDEKATNNLIKKLLEKDQREEQQRKLNEERDARLQQVEKIYNVFEGTFTMKQIKDSFDIHK